MIICFNITNITVFFSILFDTKTWKVTCFKTLKKETNRDIVRTVLIKTALVPLLMAEEAT